jgi:penicillin-binding protein 2
MADFEHLKDHYSEARIFMHRLIVVMIVIVGLLGVLLARFYNLQVVNYKDYVTRSDSNRVQVQPIPPTRGLIYDRNGILLADNRPSYTLTLIKERIGKLDETLVILDQLLSFKPEELDKFNKLIKQRRRPFEAVPLRYRLTEAEIARLAVNEYRLSGVEVKAELVRHYPLNELTAHSVGYVGRINDRELSNFDEDQYRRYSGTHTIGKIGLEKYYEEKLLGEVGYQNVETNARGRVLRVLERTDPVPGANLTLHFDSLLQQVSYKALGERRGSVVAVDVKTGGVLAMASTPSYNPNLFVTGISFKDYRALNQSLDLPLFNRAIQGQYPPGSTLKPMLGLGGLHHNVIDANYSVKDPGYYQLEGEERQYRDWKRKGHGHRINLLQAVTESCDTYYYDLAFRMGIDKIHAFGSQFGLGDRTGVDVPSERRGIWPSRDWKRRVRGLPWFPGDSLNVGIGQGDVLTTPLQLAVMTATLANRGKQFKPQFVHRVNEQTMAPIEVSQAEVNVNHWDQIFDAMESVVHGRRGTAQSIRYGMDYRIAGKTGTAQVVGIAQGEEYDSEALAERQRDHALFVAFAPADDPQIAVAVIVENGEKSSTAAKIARKVFDAYLQAEAVKAGTASVTNMSSGFNDVIEPNGGRSIRLLAEEG